MIIESLALHENLTGISRRKLFASRPSSGSAAKLQLNVTIEKWKGLDR
jgi:hypothetical protein